MKGVWDVYWWLMARLDKVPNRRRNFVQGFVGPLNSSFNYEQKKRKKVIGEKVTRS
jgi:hypothetical protein